MAEVRRSFARQPGVLKEWAVCCVLVGNWSPGVVWRVGRWLWVQGSVGLGAESRGGPRVPRARSPGVGLRSMGGLKGKAEGPEGWDRWEMWAVHPGL